MTTRVLGGMILCSVLATAAPTRAAAAPKPTANRFATVKGWLGLRWKMNLSQVQALLKQRGVKPKHEWQRGQFKHGCVRTDTLRFDWKGWKVTASLHQTWLSTLIRSKDRQTPAAVKALRKRLVRRYGPPVRFMPLGKIGKHGILAQWSNKHTKLSLAVVRQGKRYRIIQTYWRR